MIFDRREGASWEEKLYRRDEVAGHTPVTVWEYDRTWLS